jgi:dolichyl-phosphate beta-glucosyltransferase
MAAWSEVCRECVNTVATIPIEILLASIAATLLGIFVLVSPHFLARKSPYPQQHPTAN